MESKVNCPVSSSSLTVSMEGKRALWDSIIVRTLAYASDIWTWFGDLERIGEHEEDICKG